MGEHEQVWLRVPLGGGVHVTVTCGAKRLRVAHIRRLIRILGLVASFEAECEGTAAPSARVVVAGREQPRGRA